MIRQPLLASAAIVIATPALASTPVTVSAPSVTVAENISSGLAPFVLIKSKGASYSKVSVQTIDGTAKVGVDYGALNTTVTLGNAAQTWSLPIGIINNATYQGPRTFTVKLNCLRNCKLASATATITITDDEAPPPPPPPQWVSTPLGTAHYARCKIVGGCHSESAPCPSRAGANPPEVCTSPNIIAQQGDVREYRWGGCDSANPCRRYADLWPLGHDPKKTGVAADWFLGLAGFEDEWEGVAPAP
jgi:hypothetical protein